MESDRHASNMAGRSDETTHRCGHPNKHPRSRRSRPGWCLREVSDDTGHRYCQDHRHGWRERWAQAVARWSCESRPEQAAVAVIPHPRSEAEPSPPHLPHGVGQRRRGGCGWKADGLPDRYVEVAVSEAQSITSSVHWRYNADSRATAVLGELHRRIRAQSSDVCGELATLADDLLVAKKRALRLLEDSTTSILAVVTPARLARMAARMLAKQVTAVATAKVATVVATVRAYGVLLCVLEGRDLTRCRCLRSLARSEAEDQIRAEVREVVGRQLQRLKLPEPKQPAAGSS